MTASLNRRRLLAAAGLGAIATRPAAARFSTPPVRALAAERIAVAAIQRDVASSAELGPARAIASNLAAMDEAIARAQSTGRKHLIAFSGQALQGRVEDLAAAAIASDGPQIAQVAAMARRYSAHLSFGALIADGPGRVVAAAILIGSDGQLIACDWTPAALAAVHETAIGKLAHTPTPNAEIILRTSAHKPAQSTTRCFSIFTTAAAREQTAGTAIFGPNGEVLAEAGSAWQQVVTASLPIADYREPQVA